MSKKVSPIAWRLGHVPHGQYHSVWSGDQQQYRDGSVVSVKVWHTLQRVMPFTLQYKLSLNDGPRTMVLTLEIPNAQYLDKGFYLGRLKKLLSKMMPGWNIKIDVSFAKRNSLSAHLIAFEVKDLIERRQNSMFYINQVLKRAEVDSYVAGLRVEIKGRFKASARKQKVSYHVGKVPIQSIGERIEYAQREVQGKYGKSTVRVWLFKHVW